MYVLYYYVLNQHTKFLIWTLWNNSDILKEIKTLHKDGLFILVQTRHKSLTNPQANVVFLLHARHKKL